MPVHDGQTIAKVNRRDGYSISQVAMLLQINRRIP
jgi:hypothetical protein